MKRCKIVASILITVITVAALTACGNSKTDLTAGSCIISSSPEANQNDGNSLISPSVGTDISIPEGIQGKVFVVDDKSIDKAEAVEAMKNPLEGRNVFFAGYVDATITKADAVALENLPENKDFYMVYQITNKADNSMVFETDLIPSGQCVLWSPTDTLDAGVYNLQFLAVPYFCDSDGNYQELTSGCTEVCYTIK